jgi:hypothetical protein
MGSVYWSYDAWTVIIAHGESTVALGVMRMVHHDSVGL